MTLVKSLNTCLHCGRAFEAGKKTAKYCSKKCRDFMIKSCEVCGQYFNSRRQDKVATCSDKCRSTRNKWPVKGSQKQCEVCRQEFTVKNVRWARTCGRKCAAALRTKEGTVGHWKRKPWESRLRNWIEDTQRDYRNRTQGCIQCGSSRGENSKGGRCKECVARVSKRTIDSISQKVNEWLKRSTKQCSKCEKTAAFWSPFCDVCGIEARREASREAKGRRRARKKNNGAVDKGITIYGLRGRDGDKCYICGVATEFSAHYWDDSYPSVDHVIPLAKGGAHTWDNVKLAHRICNAIKSDTLPE